MSAAMIAVLGTPAVWISILGIMGTLVGFLVKRWFIKNDEQVQTEQRQKGESELADRLAKKWADESAAVNANKEIADKAADEWFKKP